MNRETLCGWTELGFRFESRAAFNRYMDVIRKNAKLRGQPEPIVIREHEDPIFGSMHVRIRKPYLARPIKEGE